VIADTKGSPAVAEIADRTASEIFRMGSMRAEGRCRDPSWS